MKVLIHRLTTWLVVLVGCHAVAAQAAQVPEQLVEETTAQILELITEARGYYAEDPERFHREVDAVLSPVIDFDAFARGVMGRYASKQYYDSLPPAQKQAYPELVKRFRDNFKQGLIQTYAKGLFEFSGERIETLAPRGGDSGPQVTVMQNIYGRADKPYVVQYTLRRDREGSWKVRNVIVEGINLGQTYRNQFASAMERHRNDLEAVIANWEVRAETDSGSSAE